MTTITASIIAGLVLLCIGPSVKIAQLLHSLKLSNRENEDIRKEYSESDKRHIEEVKNINKKYSQEISDLQQRHSKLDKSHSDLKAEHSKLNKQLSDIKRQRHFEDVKKTNDSISENRAFRPDDDFS